MMRCAKAYRAILFDWDGTAVLSRDASVDEVVPLMRALLEKGVVLVVISGTFLEVGLTTKGDNVDFLLEHVAFGGMPHISGVPGTAIGIREQGTVIGEQGSGAGTDHWPLIPDHRSLIPNMWRIDEPEQT